MTPAIHVWLAPLEAATATVRSYEESLSDEELRRSRAFKFPHLQTSYVVSHGVLRLLLSRYLSCSPRELTFERLTHGKPSLQGSAMAFNLSHSGNYALVGCRQEGSIGVDIERVRPMQDLEELMTRYMAPRESQTLLSLPRDKRLEFFFRLWSLKESYSKATGEGLTCPFHSFSVEFGPNPIVRRETMDACAPNGLLAHSFVPVTGYWAGVVSRPATGSIHFRQFAHAAVYDPIEYRL